MTMLWINKSVLGLFFSVVLVLGMTVESKVSIYTGDDSRLKFDAEGREAIAAKYDAAGGEEGRLGAPEDTYRTNPGETGMRRKYANGHIYWKSSVGAHIIYDGPIWDAWADQRWEQGVLGYPEQDPRTNPDGTGSRQQFEHGYIYRHPETGAHYILKGDIWDQWAEQRWEQGDLGYPVANPEPDPDGPGLVQRFQGGALVTKLPMPTSDAWGVAGRSNYVIHPQSDAEYCVKDVPSAFRAITFGRSNGLNFYTNNVKRADQGHMQGIARLPGGWLAHSFSKGVFLSHRPAHDGAGHNVWASGPRHGEAFFPSLPNVDRGHVGGIHAYDDILIVASDRRVEIFRQDNEELDRLSVFDVSHYQNDAHFASIVPLRNGDWLLAVGRDGRRRKKPHRMYFYVIPSLEANQTEPRFLGRRGRGRTHDDFQSASLIADCNGDVYVIGTGVRRAQVNPHAKLYRVRWFSRENGQTPNRVEWEKIAERAPKAERNDCNLDAGATFFPTGHRTLAMYCTEKGVKNGQITTREYRDEN